MAIGKWIGGFLGFIAGGPLGGLAGLVLGALFDVGLDQVNEPDRNGQPWNTTSTNTTPLPINNSGSKANAIRSSFRCWCSRHTSFVPTEK